jgi:hypothetical protein
VTGISNERAAVIPAERKLFEEARQRRAQAWRRVLTARAELDEAEAEYRELDAALSTFELMRRT